MSRSASRHFVATLNDRIASYSRSEFHQLADDARQDRAQERALAEATEHALALSDMARDMEVRERRGSQQVYNERAL